MIEPIQITVDRLYAKIGALLIENEVLREQLDVEREDAPAPTDNPKP